MIWHDGRVVTAESVRVGIDDRVFEHGLGLFETLRTWDGVAPLLGRHLDRLRASADDLGLPTAGVALPDAEAVVRLIAAARLGPDVMLRITMTGGSASGSAPVAWMSARPLPPVEPSPMRIAVDPAPGGSDAPSIARHKNLNYWTRRLAYERARAMGLAEVLLIGPTRRLWEGSRNNVLFVPAGRPTTIVTPALRGPLVPGVMRRAALDFAAGLGFTIEERFVCVDELDDAEAVYLTNSVRGVRRVDQIGPRRIDSTTCDELTRAFVEDLPQQIRGLPLAEEASA